MATIVMPSAKVIRAAQNIIYKIESKRLHENEGCILRTMAKPRIGAWFKRYNPTREQAIKILDRNSDLWGWRSMYAWGDLDKAYKLLKVAQHGDPVTLNEDDVRVLF